MDIDLTPEIVDISPKLPNRPELLLHPNIPKPLHGVNPRSILGKKWWDVVRKEVYAKNNFCCMACGTSKFEVEGRQILHAHECYDIDYKTGRVVLKEIVALCVNCHDYIHSGRMGALFDKGILDEEDCWIIRSHGDRVCGGQKDQPDWTAVPWGDWYLVLDGDRFYSKFKNQQEWEAEYNETTNRTKRDR